MYCVVCCVSVCVGVGVGVWVEAGPRHLGVLQPRAGLDPLHVAVRPGVLGLHLVRGPRQDRVQQVEVPPRHHGGGHIPHQPYQPRKELCVMRKCHSLVGNSVWLFLSEITFLAITFRGRKSIDVGGA